MEVSETANGKRRETARSNKPEAWSVAFEEKAVQTICESYDEERLELLAGYKSWPGSGMSHPEPSHFPPLIVAAAAAGDSRGRVVPGTLGCYQYSLSMAAFVFEHAKE